MNPKMVYNYPINIGDKEVLKEKARKVNNGEYFFHKGVKYIRTNNGSLNDFTYEKAQ